MNKLGIFETLLIKSTEKRKVNKRVLMNSYVSLFLAISILTLTTFSWFTLTDTAMVSSPAMKLQSTSGLRVNHGEDLSSNITLSKTVTLAEASSVDGRNMFFPTTGTFPDEGSDAENEMDTSKMIFREGNVGDRNSKYYYNNFSINVDSGTTKVYVKSYSVKVIPANGENIQTFDGSVKFRETVSENPPKECPIRIAFIGDSSTKPVVIDPTALIGTYAKSYQAVSSIDETGKPVLMASEADSFSEYYFATENPLFTVSKEEGKSQLDGTMVIWLEGTGGNCDMYAGGTVEIDIQLESNWDYMDTVIFVDRTRGDGENDTYTELNWVEHDGCIVIMSYYDTKTQKEKSVVMAGPQKNSEGKNIWKAALPDYIDTDIKFLRYNPKVEMIWNAWYTEKNINDNEKRPLSDELKGWNEYSDEGEGRKLQESRIVNENEVDYRCVTYEAIRGNGWGDTDDQILREYPGLGYWITTGGIIIDGEEEEETNSPSDPVSTPEWYLSGSFNNWATDNSSYHFAESGNNTYSLTLNLNADTYGFKLFDNNSSKYYANENNSFNDELSKSLLTESEGTENCMSLIATGGKYIFTIDTSGENPQLTVKKEAATNIKINTSFEYPSGKKMYLVYDDDTTVELYDYQGSYKRESIEVSSVRKIKGFKTSDGLEFYLDEADYPTLENNNWYTYKLNDSDKLVKT